MSECRFCTVRFNLGKADHQRAWSQLQNMDRRKYKSYSNVVIAALNMYFDNEHLGDLIAEKVVSRLNVGVGIQTVNIQPEPGTSDDDIAWDFLGDGISMLENGDFNSGKN